MQKERNIIFLQFSILEDISLKNGSSKEVKIAQLVKMRKEVNYT